ncbi:LANO_0B00254g1_1 [Lachancea nothofagi CBS 11611]|uniref:LANO_0B00254g1_1 n=1 Tax=Lachancea nothofagi CBS 11611 TaxID=1266666 RepID=A0A1G4IU81_9SACH|nr:LANO_0B00254g1_1 [Lachancea nothofagi CBS 11611]
MGRQAENEMPRTNMMLTSGSIMFYIGMATHNAALERPKSAANRLALVKFIASLKPGIDMRDWDVVAARMNSIMHRSSSLVTPYFFYDGKACYSYFRSTYLQ